ncbi:MAG: class I SAM-dependent methyltransferase [Planctomycetes bacterium]|nr:class I SAM-dependent methyltransferase [Planctomycetota bacterium]
MDSETARCLLCESNAAITCRAQGRSFFHCLQCDLCFVPPEQHPTAAQAEARYAHHRNTPDNAEYTTRLSRFIEWLRDAAPNARRVLDHGCGRDSVLSRLLRDAGFEVDGHDPLFDLHADRTRPYDAIVSCEAMEHFGAPRDELTQMSNMLHPGGVLIATTQFHRGPDSLVNWWYTRDITHLCFYSAATFSFIADRFGFTLVACDHRELAILKKHQ